MRAILFLTLLVSLANLIDFLVGEKGNKKIKERIIDMYAFFEEGDLTELYKAPAAITRAFLIDKLHNEATGKISFVKLCAYSFSAFIIVHSTTIFANSTLNKCIMYFFDRHVLVNGIMDFARPTIVDILPFAIGNLILDLVVWLFLIRILANISSATLWELAMYCMVMLFILCIAVGLSIVIQAIIVTATLIFGSSLSSFSLGHIAARLITRMIEYYISVIRGVFAGNSHIVTLSYECSKANNGVHIDFAINRGSIMIVNTIIAVIPCMLFFLSSTFLAIGYVTRNYWRRLASLMAERTYEYPKGLFTLIAAFLSAIIVIMQKVD